MNLAIFCPSTGGHEVAAQTWINRATRTWVGNSPRIDLKKDHASNTRTVEWDNFSITVDDTITGLGAGYLHKVEKFYLESTADILAYFHSDLFIHSHGWDEMVLREFEDPDVAIVSFCGAKRHGRGDLYRAPYDFRQLARADFISNLTDAENHGRRVLEPQDVAVVDSFSVIVRRSFLDLIGGWLVSGLYESHASDYWICLMAHRHKMRIRYVPVSCTHNSGGVRGDGRFDYNAWQKWYGKTDAEMHQANHHAIYSEFKDVLPVRVP